MAIVSPDQRKHRRISISSAVAITPTGACQVFYISSGGLSFRCLDTQSLPDELTVDVLDSSGFHLENCAVQKIWEEQENGSQYRSIFAQGVGVKFKKLTEDQQQALNQLLERISADKDR